MKYERWRFPTSQRRRFPNGQRWLLRCAWGVLDVIHDLIQLICRRDDARVRQAGNGLLLRDQAPLRCLEVADQSSLAGNEGAPAHSSCFIARNENAVCSMPNIGLATTLPVAACPRTLRHTAVFYALDATASRDEAAFILQAPQ